MVIGYLGPKGSFCYEVAFKKTKNTNLLLPLTTIVSVFEALEQGKIEYGIVPIENSIHGTVNETVDGLNKFDLKIIEELNLKIHHNFCSLEKSIKDIKKIYSKDVAYNQCKLFLKNNNLQDVEFIPVVSTSKGAELTSKENGVATICSAMAGKFFNVPVLFKNIEDTKDNETKFILLSKNNDNLNGKKISIIVKINNVPGSLFDFLQKFKNQNINLTKIESRPDINDKKFNYWFYIEFEGDINNKNIKDILQDKRIKFLGCY
jgi:chorismate mutase/prephenate dehydratase